MGSAAAEARPASVECFESGWCDYSREHERVRSEVERLIEQYVRGSGGGEYWMPVIVAPYGSGKTTLLRHLEWYASKRLGVPAARIEFADLVNYIVERYGSIHESMLPQVVEEYAAERLGVKEGLLVLLVDEVEESYDVFRGVVEHETSPLRGLAEAIRTRSTRVFVVLAFGPSSTLKEAVFGPVAWRSRVYTIPLIPKPVLARWVSETLSGRGGEHTELLANTLWWASKGRVAWARLLVETVLPRLASALEEGPEAVEAVLLGDETLSREIVEGVPLLDRQGYREAKRFLEDPRLAPILAALVGPTPLSLASRLAGGELFPGNGPVTGVTRLVVDAGELVAAASTWMERAARLRGASSDSVERAVTALEHVVSAYSYRGQVPFDPQVLRELFSLAADLARELYGDDPAAGQLLDSLNPDLVAPEPSRAPEPLVYLKPSMVARVYPVASSSPVVGCARRTGWQQVSRVVEGFTWEELETYWGQVKEVLGLKAIEEDKGLVVEAATPSHLEAAARRLACRGLSSSSRVVLLELNPRGGSSGAPASRALEGLGVLATTAGQRLSMFVYSLLYSLSLGMPSCSLEKLSPSEKRALSIYGELLKSLVLETASKQPAGLRRVASEAARVEARLPRPVVEALAAAAAERGVEGVVEEARRLKESLGAIASAARELAELVGAKYDPAMLPSPGTVEKLATVLREGVEEAEIARLRGLLSGCSGSSGSRVVDALLGLCSCSKHSARLDTGGLVEAARAVGGGVAGRVSSVATVLEDLEGAAAAAAQAALAGLLAELQTGLESAARMLTALDSMLSQLPSNISARLRAALQEDLESVRNIPELLGYLEEASQLLSRLVAESHRLREIERLEERRRLLAERLARVFGLNTSPPQAQLQPARAQVEAGVEG